MKEFLIANVTVKRVRAETIEEAKRIFSMARTGSGGKIELTQKDDNGNYNIVIFGDKIR